MLKRPLASVVIGAALITVASIGLAHAAPVAYYFSANGFTAFVGSPLPNSSVSGSVTIDGSTVTGIDLKIGSHTYAPSEVGFNSAPAGFYGIVGGTVSGVIEIRSLTDDFWIQGNFSPSTGTS